MTRSPGRPEPDLLPRIVIAEADEDTRALYRESLQSLAAEVVVTSDGRDALVECLIEPPALLITETRLPGLDGYGLCETLRHDPLTRSMPILVVTSDIHPGLLARIKRLGAVAIVSKPAPMDHLVSEVARLCRDPASSASADDGSPTGGVNEVAPGARKIAATRAFRRFVTTRPPARPPALSCLHCEVALDYLKSRIGGVRQRDAEQWDEFRCPRCQRTFEYRHRTRKLRPA